MECRRTGGTLTTQDGQTFRQQEGQTDRQTTGVQTTQKQTDKKGLGRDKEGEGGTDRQ